MPLQQHRLNGATDTFFTRLLLALRVVLLVLHLAHRAVELLVLVVLLAVHLAHREVEQSVLVVLLVLHLGLVHLAWVAQCLGAHQPLCQAAAVRVAVTALAVLAAQQAPRKQASRRQRPAC